MKSSLGGSSPLSISHGGDPYGVLPLVGLTRWVMLDEVLLGVPYPVGYSHGGPYLVDLSHWVAPMVGIPSGVFPWWAHLVGCSHGGSYLVGPPHWVAPMVGRPSGVFPWWGLPSGSDPLGSSHGG